MDYPTIEEVNNASRIQICTWYRHLQTPGDNLTYSDTEEYKNKVSDQRHVMDLICVKFKEVDGFTPEISKSVGW